MAAPVVSTVEIFLVEVVVNSDGSDVVDNGQLISLVARHGKRQSNPVSLVVIARQGPSSPCSPVCRSRDAEAAAAPLVEDPDGVGATVGDEHQSSAVGADPVWLQQRLVVDVGRRATG